MAASRTQQWSFHTTMSHIFFQRQTEKKKSLKSACPLTRIMQIPGRDSAFFSFRWTMACIVNQGKKELRWAGERAEIITDDTKSIFPNK